MGEPHLRVTERCLKDDLGLDANLVKKDAREFKNAHKAVKKFVHMRGNDPAGAEPIYGPFKRGLVGSLHVGSARGATHWDEEEGVCWLLAFDDYHRNGEPDDAYETFIALFNKGELLPTVKDYNYFFTTTDEDAFFEELLEEGQRLLERARANPGHEEVSTWHDHGRQVMCVDLLIEESGSAEEGWMGLTLPENEALPDEEVFALVQALIPPGATPIYRDKFRDRERRRGEIVYSWDHWDYDEATE